MKTVLTYGTFDIFHVGHLRLFRRLREIGDRLIVGVSTDEFNTVKGKRSLMPYAHRAEIVAGVKYVDLVIPESSWDQKIDDVKNHAVAVFGIGDDWTGEFDFLKSYCEVVYLPRTHNVSSSSLKRLSLALDQTILERLAEAQAVLSDLLGQFKDD